MTKFDNKISVLIIGAGSIGNHLANVCRIKKWDVSIYDIDKNALERTKNLIYPSRYGGWDKEIKLLNNLPYSKYFDIVIIGTPPESHISIAKSIINSTKPKLILIEKPLCTPEMNGLSEFKFELKKSTTTVLVGYNHNKTQNTKFAEGLINEGLIGEPLSIHVRWLEHWGGIFTAHPWLKGPQDSYLGFWEKGGGACCEHSHAISIWQHFSNFLNFGNIKEVLASMSIFKKNNLNYDFSTILNVKSEKGLTGSIIQDVVTFPSQKNMRIQGSDGFIEWYANYDEKNDCVIFGKKGENYKKELIPKTRPDDFMNEIEHVHQIIIDDYNNNISPISFESGIKCMQVIQAAFESNRIGKKVNIN